MIYDSGWIRIACVTVFVIATNACANRTDELTPDSCAAYQGEAALDPDAIGNLVGEFQLALTATSGPHSGETAKGVLTFRANVNELRMMANPAGEFMRNVVVPYYGMSNIDPAAVGALPLGTAESDDPNQPGVLVIQTNTTDGSVRSLVMRVGADANARAAVPFDGGYTVLRVRYASSDSLLGEWASGTMTDVATGYFCAIRR